MESWPLNWATVADNCGMERMVPFGVPCTASRRSAEMANVPCESSSRCRWPVSTFHDDKLAGRHDHGLIVVPCQAINLIRAAKILS